MTRFLVNFYLFLSLTLVFSADLKEIPILGSKNIPRLLTEEITAGLYYRVRQNHSVFFKPEDSEDLYVGVTDFVYTFDMDHLQFIDNFNVTGQNQQCSEEPCKNVVTVIEKLQDKLLVQLRQECALRTNQQEHTLLGCT